MARRQNSGVRKRCPCPRRNWPKCPHAWHFNYKPRGKPHYRLSLDRETGRHVESKTEALRIAGRLRMAIDEGTYKPLETPPESVREIPVEPAANTLREYVNSWLETAALNLKASTLRFYRDNLENHILPRLGEKPVTAVTRRDCRELVAAARSTGLKIETVRGILRTLSTVLSQAVEDELLPSNPALAMRKHLRRGDEPESGVDPFTKDETSALVRTAQTDYPQWCPWLLCALRTGMRAGELLGLQWGDIDWHGRFIQVQRSIVRGTITTPKNHQARRVDMSPQLRTALRLWRRRKSAEWLEQELPRPEWIFPSSLGTPLDESNVRKAFNQILDRAGLHRRGPHQMRHTFASLLLQAGEPITYVSRQLGHKDSAITLRVYAHWLPETGARRGVDQLDEQAPAVAQALHNRPHESLPQAA